MSNRLAFQTQLASIMEVLANAAVAEICKLVDDDYAVVRLQMSQCQRENKALKRKLHLLELKMARGNAERRLRESAMNSSRLRVQINTEDRLREPPSTDDVYERQIDVALWSNRASAGESKSQPVHSDSIQIESPDVELVEPEAVLVKKEKMETNMSQVEETEKDVALIGDDGVLECGPCGVVGQRLSNEQHDSKPQNQIQISRMRRPSSSSSVRGVEREDDPDVVLVKVEEGESVTPIPKQTGLSIQEGLVESSTDDYRGITPLDESIQSSTNQLCELQEPNQAFSEPTSVISEDCNSVAVRLRLPDTNSPANPDAERSTNNNPLTSEYSLLELETFFTRWAPDNNSAPSGSCSFSTDDQSKCNKDGLHVVETERWVPSGAKKSERQSLSSAASCATAEVLSAGTSLSKSLRMQAPPSSLLWSPTPAIMSVQSKLLHKHQKINRISQRQQQQQDQSIPSTQSTQSSSTANSSDKTSVSHMSPICKKMSSCVFLPVRRSQEALPSFEEAVNAHHRATLLSPLNKTQAVCTISNDRRRKAYVCRSCGKAFSGLSNLEAHERVHTGEKPFRCDTCGKHFSEAGNLKKHQRVHTGEKPFSCDQCGKRFAWICNLRTHQQSATSCGSQGRGGLGLG